MSEIGWIAVAGAFGAVARFMLGRLVQGIVPGQFPFGTLIVNVLGCLLFGIVWQLAEQRLWLDAESRLVILVGFAGAFTTYSSFAFETMSLLSTGHIAYVVTNIAANLIGGWIAVAGGVALVRLFQ